MLHEVIRKLGKKSESALTAILVRDAYSSYRMCMSTGVPSLPRYESRKYPR